MVDFETSHTVSCQSHIVTTFLSCTVSSSYAARPKTGPH